MKTLKKYSCLIIMIYFSTCSFDGKAQNLVPNPSFELYDTCPNSIDQIQFATGWNKYSIASSTPDYYNSCANPGFFGVPNAGGGYQQAHTGDAYAAIGTYVSYLPNYREHIGIQLSQPLIIGQEYFLSMYAVLAGIFFQFGAPSNNLGIRLSTIPFNGSNPTPVDNFAHVYSSIIIDDTINWTHISGSIIADSAYQYIVLGNFFDDAHTDTIKFDSLSNQSYYYIDDICISTDSFLCNTSVKTSELKKEPLFSFYPNPANNFINIDIPFTDVDYDIIIYNSICQEIFTRQKIPRHITIDLSTVSNGMMLIKITNKNEIFNYKFIKQ